MCPVIKYLEKWVSSVLCSLVEDGDGASGPWKSFLASWHHWFSSAGSIEVDSTTVWLSQPPGSSSPHRLRHIHHRENILESLWQLNLYLLKVNPRLKQTYSIRGLLNFLIKCNQGTLLSGCQVKAITGGEIPLKTKKHRVMTIIIYQHTLSLALESSFILMKSIKCWRCALQLTQSHKPRELVHYFRNALHW